MEHDFKLNEEDAMLTNRQKKGPGGIIGWLMRKGIVQNPGQANALLILVIIVGIAGIIYINLRTFGS
jgi:hypothetical protein